MARIGTKRLIVCDLETTGANPQRDLVIQVGAVALDDSLEAVGEFEAKIRFDRECSAPAALQVNSFEEGAWEKGALSEKEAARRFSAFLHEHATIRREGRSHGKPFFVAQLASYNAAFDGPFVQAWFERAGEFLPASFQTLCVLQRVHFALLESVGCRPPENLKLGTVCRELGIPLGENAHDALHDARATASLYRVLHGMEPLLLPTDSAVSVSLPNGARLTTEPPSRPYTKRFSTLRSCRPRMRRRRRLRCAARKH